MSFTDLNFITRFLPLFMVVYLAVPNKYKNITLLLGSIICYGMGDVYRLLILLAVTLVNFVLIRFISSGEEYKRKIPLIIGIVLDAGILIGFKYFADEMPLGISFYTFMMIASLVDVYRRDVEDVNLINYFTFTTMFPKMVQGPVIPLKDVSESLKKRKTDIYDIQNGLEIFITGMMLKVIIADEIGKLWMSVKMVGFESVSMPFAWLGVIAFSMQLYFDFWGYSVMARGIGEMLGIPIMRNFNHPYSSLTVGEFYRRWHISLGRWFKEYIYIPLGGNRKGEKRHIFNLAVVWLFTGIWHGTSLNFLLWAGILFIFIVLEKFVIGDFLESHKVIGHIYIWFVIPITWSIFAVEDFGMLGVLLSRMFPFGNGDAFMTADALHYGPSYIWVMILAFIVSLPKVEELWEKYRKTVAGQIVLFVVFWICIYFLANGSGNTFMYARF